MLKETEQQTQRDSENHRLFLQRSGLLIRIVVLLFEDKEVFAVVTVSILEAVARAFRPIGENFIVFFRILRDEMLEQVSRSVDVSTRECDSSRLDVLGHVLTNLGAASLEEVHQADNGMDGTTGEHVVEGRDHIFIILLHIIMPTGIEVERQTYSLGISVLEDLLHRHLVFAEGDHDAA